MTVAVVTGGFRGIGAATALQLADRGVDVVINFRNKAARAERVAEQVRQRGRRAVAVQADLTDATAVRIMIDSTVQTFGRLDLPVLNASGGLESDMPADYAMRLNRDAQLRVADHAAERMAPGGRIVFVSSHEAHVYGDHPTLPEYEPVAASEQAGERALIGRAAAYAERGLSLVVISGDLIDESR